MTNKNGEQLPDHVGLSDGDVAKVNYRYCQGWELNDPTEREEGLEFQNDQGTNDIRRRMWSLRNRTRIIMKLIFALVLFSQVAQDVEDLCLERKIKRKIGTEEEEPRPIGITKDTVTVMVPAVMVTVGNMAKIKQINFIFQICIVLKYLFRYLYFI